MRQRNLVLILARDLADKLASAVIVVDAEGTVVYFNERCAELLGRTFAEVGEVHMDEISKDYSPTDVGGRPLEPSELPLATTLRSRMPTHLAFCATGPDGETRDLAATALPLYAHKGEMVGAVAVFWERLPGEVG